MKLGTEDKKKTRLAILLFAVAALAIVYEVWSSSSTPSAGPPARATTASNAAPAGKGRPAAVFSKLDPTLRTDLLKGSEESSYEGSGRDIFHAQAEVSKADIPDVAKTPIITTTAPPVHTNPPIPLKFYGFASANNKKQIFLSQGEDVFVAKEGDIVKGRYKVVRVGPKDVEIQDVLGNYSQSIPLTLPNANS